MSVKLTLGELKDAEKGLTAILTTGLPIKLSYNLQKGLKAINQEFQNFESIRTELVKKYGTEQDGGFNVQAGSEEFKLFMAEYEELNKVEVELWFTPINLNELPETVTISVVDLAPLIGKFILAEESPSL